MPRTRLYFEGRLTRPIAYEVSLQRSIEGTIDLLDAYVNFELGAGAADLRFGRGLVPYSCDWYDHLEPYFITPERSLFPLNLGLSRQAGLMGWGYLLDDRLEYAVGGFAGGSDSIADNNRTYDAVGYLNARPFLDRVDSPLRFLEHRRLDRRRPVGPAQPVAARSGPRSSPPRTASRPRPPRSRS